MERIDGYYWACKDNKWEVVEFFSYGNFPPWSLCGSDINLTQSEMDDMGYEILKDPIPEPSWSKGGEIYTIQHEQ